MSENERSRKLPKRYEDAITALLGTNSFNEAAALLGINVSTLRRWMRVPEFMEAYHEARKAVYEATLTRLQKASEKAVDTLVKNLGCGQFATEVRAAQAILEHAAKGHEMLDIEHRLEQLESRVTSKDQSES